MAENLGTYHIASNLENYEVARTNFFTLVVEDLDGITKVEYNKDLGDATEADRIHNAQEVLKLSVDAMSVPHYQLGVHEIRRGNSVVKYAGVPTFSAGELVVKDYVGLDVKSVLMAWQGLAYDVNTDKGGRMVNYKKNAVLYEYTQDFKEIRHWNLFGCWIDNISEPGFDVTSDTEKQITASIQYDRAEMHLPQ